MSSYRDRRDTAIANDFLSGQGQCRYCGSAADNETLSNLGARCSACYAGYCAGGRQYPALTQDDKRELARRTKAALQAVTSRNGQQSQAAEAALRLRAIEAQGRRLTGGQRWVLQCCESKCGLVRAAGAGE